MQVVKPLTDKLSKFYWSPQVPESYRIVHPVSKTLCGIGLVAGRDYGAFNLAWAGSNGKWDTLAHQLALCGAFNVYSKVTGIILPCKTTLGELTSLLSPLEFVAAIRRPNVLEPAIAKGIIPTLDNIERMVYEQQR